MAGTAGWAIPYRSQRRPGLLAPASRHITHGNIRSVGIRCLARPVRGVKFRGPEGQGIEDHLGVDQFRRGKQESPPGRVAPTPDHRVVPGVLSVSEIWIGGGHTLTSDQSHRHLRQNSESQAALSFCLSGVSRRTTRLQFRAGGPVYHNANHPKPCPSGKSGRFHNDLGILDDESVPVARAEILVRV